MFLMKAGLSFKRAKGSFIMINPAIPTAFNGKTQKVVRATFTALYYKSFIKRAKSTNIEDLTGALLAGLLIQKYYRQPMKKFVQKGYDLNIKTFVPLNESHLMQKKRTWFNKTGKMKVRIIYHVGNKRGAHIDMHFNNGTSFVIDVRNKPLANLIKTNSEGHLTQKSINLLMDHVRNEFDGNGYGSRVFQNFDHNPEEAAMEWWNDELKEGYGSGPIREVIHESDVHVMWNNADDAGQGTSIYMPGISPTRYVYFHQLYKASGVAKMGFKSFKDSAFKDKLHLKMIDEETYKSITDNNTTTLKYDGASAYIQTNKHGTIFFSPRISTKTGHRIDYTGKMPTDVINTKSDINYKGMGELLFKRDGKYLSATEIGGLLNKNEVIPDDIETEFRLYRIDQMGRQDMTGLDFFENRSLAESVASNFNSTVKVPDFISIDKAKEIGAEGVVGTAPGDSVFNGFKLKFKDNLFDWKIKDIKLKYGPKGNMAGVVIAESLESGKEFNLGPGQLGNHEIVQQIMDNPSDYIGRVLRVEGFRGHEGRAAKVVDFHMDK